eukprot:COSAG02_NODE_9020_length_2358_cov_2.369190_4_plen_137_part_00
MLRRATAAISAGGGLYALYDMYENSIITVRDGERALIFNKLALPHYQPLRTGPSGFHSDVLGPGRHLVVPLVQEKFILNVKPRPTSERLVLTTKDNVTVHVCVRATAHPVLATLTDTCVLPSHPFKASWPRSDYIV